MKPEKIRQHLDSMAEKWPSSLVSRNKIAAFTGGLITPGRIANLDSEGKGPEAFKVGRKVCYPVQPLIEWLSNRSGAVDD